MDEQKKIKILKYFDHGLQKPFSKNKEERFIKKILSTCLKKKEDIKMDEQKKIKILKYFDHGLQKPFSKNKEERISQNL